MLIKGRKVLLVALILDIILIVIQLLVGGFSIALPFGLSIHLERVDNPFIVMYCLLGVFLFLHLVQNKQGAISKIGELFRKQPHTHYWLAGIALLGLVLRLAQMPGEDFSVVDEPLYRSMAQEIVSGNVFLKYVEIDKPPLYFYILSLFFRIFGSSVHITRLPNIVTQLIMITLVFSLGKHWYSTGTGLFAAALQAVNPLDVFYGSRVFLEPTMGFWFLLSVYCVEREFFLFAGLTLGCALATHPISYLLLPVYGYYLLRKCGSWRGQTGAAERWVHACSVWILGFLIVGGLLFWWSQSNTNLAMFHAQLHNYDASRGISLLPLSQWPRRIYEWLHYLRLMNFRSGDALMALLVFSVLLVHFVRNISGLFRGLLHLKPHRFMHMSEGQSRSAQLFLAFLPVCYLVIVFSAFNFKYYDRYMLPAIPFLSLLTGRCLDRFNGQYAALVQRILVLLILIQSLFNVGGQLKDYYDYSGLSDLCRYIRYHVPPKQVFLERKLEWHLRSYLHGYPTHHTRYDSLEMLESRIAYLKLPIVYLIDDLQDEIEVKPLLERLKKRDFLVHNLYTTFGRKGKAKYRLYRLQKQG